MTINTLVHIQCNSAEELLVELRKLVASRSHGKPTPDRWVWRGQGDAQWELVPSAFRPATILGYGLSQYVRTVTGRHLGSRDQFYAEYFAVYEFLHLADKLGLHVPGDSQIFRTQEAFAEVMGKPYRLKWPPHQVLEVMALAQHHGVPTRLLDFSRRPNVAAYFAASDAKKMKTDSFAIWGIDTDFLYMYRVKSGATERISQVTVPRAFNRNLHAQHGLFLLDRWIGALASSETGEVGAQLNRAVVEIAQEAWRACGFNAEWKPLVTITAPTSIASDLLELLGLEGYDEAHLMPSFDSVVRLLREQQQRAASALPPPNVQSDRE